jgi:hypothetical protein
MGQAVVRCNSTARTTGTSQYDDPMRAGSLGAAIRAQCRGPIKGLPSPHILTNSFHNCNAHQSRRYHGIPSQSFG